MYELHARSGQDTLKGVLRGGTSLAADGHNFA